MSAMVQKTVVLRVGRLGSLRFFPNARVGVFHHHLAVIHADEIFLEDAMIEHVFGCLTEIHDPFTERR